MRSKEKPAFRCFPIETPEPDTDALSKRLRQAIDACNSGESRSYQLSLSWGMIIYDPGAPCSLDQIMAAADRQMYVRKKAKRTPRHNLPGGRDMKLP